jgi:hypothetical protein
MFELVVGEFEFVLGMFCTTAMIAGMSAMMAAMLRALTVLRMTGLLGMRRVLCVLLMRGVLGGMLRVMQGIVLAVMCHVMFGRMPHRLPFSRLFGGLVRRLVRWFGWMPVMVVFTCHALTLCLRRVAIPIARYLYSRSCAFWPASGPVRHAGRQSVRLPVHFPVKLHAGRTIRHAPGKNMKTVPVASSQRKWHCRH